MMTTHNRPSAGPGRRARRLALAAGAALLAAGCTATKLENFPDTGSVLERSEYVERTPLAGLSDYQEAAQIRVKELLSKPLTVGAAVEIAMLNSPELQEYYQGYQI